MSELQKHRQESTPPPQTREEILDTTKKQTEALREKFEQPIRVEEPEEEARQRAEDATVEVALRYGTRTLKGAGIILTYDGKIATVNHVIPRDGTITVSYTIGKNGKVIRERATVLHRDPDTDLAVLQIHHDAPLLPAILATGNSLHKHEVFFVGNPLGAGEQTRRGTLGGQRLANYNGKFRSFNRITASVELGNSGGGAFDQQTGECIGIVIARSTKRKNTGYVLPVDQLTKYLRDVEGKTGKKLELVDANQTMPNIDALIYMLNHQDTQPKDIPYTIIRENQLITGAFHSSTKNK